MDEDTSELMMKYVIFIKPIVALFTHMVSPDLSVVSVMELLFTADGVRMNAKRLCGVIEKSFTDEGVRFNVSLYRHWTSGMVGMITEVTTEFGLRLIEEYRETGHLQANRTEDTADRK